MDQGLLTGAVFIDLRKAFDSVDYGLLIRKLQSIGLKKTELNWFKSYLLDRKQVIRIGTETSDYCPIGHVRYINILAWVRGFRVKFANFSCFFCLNFQETLIQRKQHQI